MNTRTAAIAHFRPQLYRFPEPETNRETEVAQDLPEWLRPESDKSDSPTRRPDILINPSMRFDEAAERWLQSRAAPPVADPRRGKAYYLRPFTLKAYTRHIGSLRLFFRDLPLSQISFQQIHRYQIARLNGYAPFVRRRRPHEEPGPCPTKAPHVNQEVRLLVRILKRAGLWKNEIVEYHADLRQEHTNIVRALTQEEEERWLKVAASNDRWRVVYLYSLLCLSTCMSTNEVRALRLGDIDFEAQVLTVPVEGAKNKYRHRTLPIEDGPALDAVKSLVQRAKDVGAGRPEHYLFPFRMRKVWDVTKPMGSQGIKKQWEEVREAAKLPALRMYDLRHTAITRKAEAGAPIAVIMALAGHVSPQMTRHYTQVSMQAKRKAMRGSTPEKAQPAVTVSAVPSWGLNWSLGSSTLHSSATSLRLIENVNTTVEVQA